MKMVFSILSFVFLFACLLGPLMIIMALNGVFGDFGEYTVFIWALFPLLGLVSALSGKKGLIKIIGASLNGIAFGCLLLLVFVR
ncbi:hypothetical protein [Domibacillus indicus]|uniref:hypothetical protein n=1 Tax=Domibacillus indicus TaxID=1437523 RepID=UPI0006181065|nr:hypothetical protein [Domibacillus indicus]